MYLSFSKIRVKELTQLPASTCKPCARATTFASAPGPSYTSQLLTTVAPNTNRRLVVYDLSLVGIGAQRRVVQPYKYRPSKLSSLYSVNAAE